ncbi:hypothetical protein COB64_02720 [Candidatus Wolfebacteria bacterium]|nr:MAG: hypothetical protein COB64_02720 [Candidatus Wolfebacteria bacterium]
MDIEKLTKAQLILLVLLVSFVTSIATGITTVTLMNQAPPEIIQPITRVVQNTVEKILPSEVREITTTNTIIIKEEDLIIEAINENLSHVVTIYIKGDDETDDIESGTGFLISSRGEIVTNKFTVSQSGEYVIKIDDTSFELEILGEDEYGYAYLQPVEIEGDQPVFATTLQAAESSLNIGQNVISLSGNPVVITIGRIAGFESTSVIDEDTEIETKTLEKILITSDAKKTVSGDPVINSDGELVGFISGGSGEIFIVPLSLVNDSLQGFIEEEDTAIELTEGELTNTEIII